MTGNAQAEDGNGGLVDVREAGRYLACSPWTVRKKIYSGEIIGVKVGTKLCVERAELDRYIRKHRTSSPVRGGEC
jgi:excisionase family DNA binding protein